MGMKTSSFSFYLPSSLIAQDPVYPRDHCRLLVFDRKKALFQDAKFYRLQNFLKPGDVLVFNDSRVLPARFLFEYEGKKGELFLTRHLDQSDWLAIGKPGKFLQQGMKLQLSSELQATIVTIQPDGQRLVRFSEKGTKLDFLLRQIGHTPLPPYISHSTASFEDYQTVYASEEGSVAAPTAGLHFTKRLLNVLSQAGVQLEFVTLHVGLGTFLPVKSYHIEDHLIHSEYFSVHYNTARRLHKAKQEGRRIIAVGTTSVRVLESSFFQGEFRAGIRETSIYIYPGYQWQAVDALITNFHLPQSTLFLLVSSFAGRESVLKAYDHALRHHYRFYSFGDAMLIY